MARHMFEIHRAQTVAARWAPLVRSGPSATLEPLRADERTIAVSDHVEAVAITHRHHLRLACPLAAILEETPCIKR